MNLTNKKDLSVKNITSIECFNKLSEIYAKETYRDNFKPLGVERQKARIKYENSTEEMLWSDHWIVSVSIDDYPDYIPDFLKPEWAKLPRAGEGIEYKALILLIS